MAKPDKDGVIFDPRSLERNQILEGSEPTCLWCLHCERAYLRGKCRQIGNLQMCPYADCDGDAVIDAWDWGTVREENPSYPERPIEGTVYPLYGPK